MWRGQRVKVGETLRGRKTLCVQRGWASGRHLGARPPTRMSRPTPWSWICRVCHVIASCSSLPQAWFWGAVISRQRSVQLSSKKKRPATRGFVFLFYIENGRAHVFSTMLLYLSVLSTVVPPLDSTLTLSLF